MEEYIEKDKRKRNSKKDEKREGKLQDKNDENIYLVDEEDPGVSSVCQLAINCMKLITYFYY